MRLARLCLSLACVLCLSRAHWPRFGASVVHDWTTNVQLIVSVLHSPYNPNNIRISKYMCPACMDLVTLKIPNFAILNRVAGLSRWAIPTMGSTTDGQY